MELSHRQLRQLVAETDELHRDGMRSFRRDHEEVIHDGERRRSAASRRRFLGTAGLGGLTVAIGPAMAPLGRLLTPAAAQQPSDVDLARFAASLEFAAVAAYEAAVGTGLLSQPVVEAGTTFAGHHREHGDAFAALVGETVPANQTVLDTFGPSIASAPDEAAIVEIAFGIENAAASTYLFALGVLAGQDAINAVASILPVESQHAVVLGFVLGRDLSDTDLLPAFEPLDNALSPDEFPAAS
ncbi:MAG: ferritin-like domain-containing protein [Acidimicrobiales bacterium]